MEAKVVSPIIVARLEEQIRMLTIKLEDMYARLDNVTSIIQETNNPLNNLLSPSDVSNFNARLVIVENELAILRRKAPPNNENRTMNMEPKPKQLFLPQGILIDSDEEEHIVKSYAVSVQEPMSDFTSVDRARSLLKNAEQWNRDLLRTMQTK